MDLTEIDKEIYLNENIRPAIFVIDKISMGSRIDKFLANQLKSTSRTQIQNAFETERIKVNGISITKNYRIKNCDIISIVLSNSKPDFDILSQNISIAVDQKKAGNETISLPRQPLIDGVQKHIENDASDKLNETNNQIIQKNGELKNIKIHLDSVEKKLQATSDKLIKNEQNLNIENNKNVLLGHDITKLLQAVATLKNELTELNNALQTKEKEILKLQSEKNLEDNLLREERTKRVGKFDAWNREKFEILQANTKQQFNEYHKMLAYYQNELDRFRGKKPEEKTILEENKEVYIIPFEEKTFSAGEFDTWSQEKFEELEENTKRQFHEYDLLLERYGKHLDKYKGKEDHEVLAIKKTETYAETDKAPTIIEKIEHILSDFLDKVMPFDKETETKKNEEGEKIRGLWKWLEILCVSISIISIILFIGYILWQKR